LTEAEKKKKKSINPQLDSFNPSSEEKPLRIAILPEEVPFWRKFGSRSMQAKLNAHSHRGPI